MAKKRKNTINAADIPPAPAQPQLITDTIEKNFMREEHKNIWQVATSPQEAIDLIYSTPWWDKNVRKFAAI